MHLPIFLPTCKLYPVTDAGISLNLRIGHFSILKIVKKIRVDN
jgi:hypothetical protein